MSNWRDILVQNSISLRTAMEIIDRTGLQTVLVNSKDETFLGTLTDGDIRRAILAGAKLEDSIESYLNSNPITISGWDEQKVAYAAMERLALRCVPVIDNGQIIGLLSQNKTIPSHHFKNGGRTRRKTQALNKYHSKAFN
jgi:CBS domain-containing protein